MEHGAPRGVGVRDPRDRVGHTGPRRHDGDADPPREASIRARAVGGRLLVAHVDECDGLAEAAVVDRQAVAAAEREHMAHARPLERPRDQLPARHSVGGGGPPPNLPGCHRVSLRDLQTRLACACGSHCGPATACGSHDHIHRLASAGGAPAPRPPAAPTTTSPDSPPPAGPPPPRRPPAPPPPSPNPPRPPGPPPPAAPRPPPPT